MEALYLVLPLALLFSASAVGFFVWAAKNGQFDDLDTPAMRILFDENTHTNKSNPPHKTTPPTHPHPPPVHTPNDGQK